jgi:hypothetical protein
LTFLLHKWKNVVTKGKKCLWLCFLLSGLFAENAAFSQARDEMGQPSQKSSNSKGFDPDRLILGGNLGLQFGSTFTVIEVSPTLGYRLTDRYIAGIGARYIYFRERLFGSNFETNIYGGSIYNQYFFIENLFGHAEYEILSLQSRQARTENRLDVHSIFIGGGYRSQLGTNSFGMIMILYNINESVHSPYTNPIIRVGFGFGL